MNAINQTAFAAPKPATGGLWGHSGHTGGERYVLFCVGQEVAQRHDFEKMADRLGIGFKRLIGAYQGVVEHSYIANARHLDTIRLFTGAEDSILVLGEADARDRRPATLVYTDGRDDVPLGRFHSTSEADAKSRVAWTYDAVTGAYFVCD